MTFSCVRRLPHGKQDERQRGHVYHAQPPPMKSPAAFTAQWGPAWAVTNICALTRAAYFVAGRLQYHVFGQFQGLPWCWPKLAEEPTGSTLVAERELHPIRLWEGFCRSTVLSLWYGGCRLASRLPARWRDGGLVISR